LYAFVFFHPTTFEMMPMAEADVPLYKEFTDLKSNGLQTWVAVGGVSPSSSFCSRPLITINHKLSDVSRANSVPLAVVL
jgi:hypothetical protein